MQKDLEERAISLLKDNHSFDEIIRRGVTSECFVLHTELFDFISKYYYKYNSVPSEPIIQTNFSEFDYKKDVKPEELKYLSDELVKSNIQRKAIRIINDASDLITTDPYGTIESVINKLSNVKRNTTDSRSFMDKEALKRYTLVLENKEKTGQGLTVGLKTGISLLDKKYIGWMPGNLIAIIGRMGVGKSWLLAYCACVGYLSGKRVLYISPEMPKDEVNLRCDTIISAQQGKVFLNDKLQDGSVNLKDYKDFLQRLSTREDWMTVESSNGRAFNIQNITHITDEFSPDLVAVDGIGLLEASARDAWQKVQESAYGLKTLSQTRKVVVMVTSQVNRNALDNTNGMPQLEDIYMGDATGQAASVVIAMSNDVNKPEVRYITIPKRRNGKAINKPLEIKFSVNEGIISI
jgi:replicative DNA helicase